jgi:hypothetical protein
LEERGGKGGERRIGEEMKVNRSEYALEQK